MVPTHGRVKSGTDGVAQLLDDDAPSNAPRNTADHKPTKIHIKSARETLFKGGGSTELPVTVLVELHESSSEYVLCRELAIKGVRSSAPSRP